ncbi:hypothetical protein U9M48_011617 [Paspalum notatum var. saurae]|uniref:Uncharacterized protein n=1 Tax=Paspalum notatum var. saurae TaxID=547442 RepID=A0AAQ3SW67_PASNO
MDPCPFVRVLVGDLALKLPPPPPPPSPSPSARGAGTHVHPTTAHCYCRIRLDGVPYQTAATAPLLPPTEDGGPASCTGGLAAAFHLSKPDIDRAAAKPSELLLRAFRPRHGAARLKVAVYVARCGGDGGGAKARGRLLGKVALPLDLTGSGALARPVVFHAGWVPVAEGRAGKGELHLTVRADPDPRFVFQFEGEPERSPLVMQVRGGMRQPMFTCRFSACRGAGGGDLRSRSAHSSDPGFGGPSPPPPPSSAAAGRAAGWPGSGRPRAAPAAGEGSSAARGGP